MKILLIEPNNFLGRELYYELTNLGHEVKVVTTDLKYMESHIPQAKYILWFFHHQINPFYLREVDVIISFLGSLDNMFIQKKKDAHKYEMQGLKNLVKTLSQDAPFRKRKLSLIQVSSIYFFEGKEDINVEDSSPGKTELSLFYQDLELEVKKAKKSTEKLVIFRLGTIISSSNPFLNFLDENLFKWTPKFNESSYYSVSDDKSILNFLKESIRDSSIKGTYNLTERHLLLESLGEEIHRIKGNKKATWIPRWLRSYFIPNKVNKYLGHNLKVSSSRYRLR